MYGDGNRWSRRDDGGGGSGSRRETRDDISALGIATKGSLALVSGAEMSEDMITRSRKGEQRSSGLEQRVP
jgi:hypothetical protein